MRGEVTHLRKFRKSDTDTMIVNLIQAGFHLAKSGFHVSEAVLHSRYNCCVVRLKGLNAPFDRGQAGFNGFLSRSAGHVYCLISREARSCQELNFPRAAQKE